MFISMLTPEQQQSLCSIVRFIAQVDDENTYRGDVLTTKLQMESVLTEVPPPVNDMDEIKTTLHIFNTDLSKRVLILECLGVALADMVAHPDEISVINEIGAELHLDTVWIDRARDYVQRVIEIQREGQELLVG